jgi:salicylate hydroxylase
MPRWTVGRVSLLVDACYSMVPFLAQGALMAIEDGYILARGLTQGQGDPSGRLVRYENARRERTRRAVEGSADNLQRFHNRALADPVKGRQYVEREWAGQRIAERYEWLFRYDVTTVAI